MAVAAARFVLLVRADDDRRAGQAGEGRGVGEHGGVGRGAGVHRARFGPAAVAASRALATTALLMPRKRTSMTFLPSSTSSGWLLNASPSSMRSSWAWRAPRDPPPMIAAGAPR